MRRGSRAAVAQDIEDITFHEGDCRDVLRRMAATGEFVHSVVTDPPYHLESVVKRFGSKNAAAAKAGSDGRFARQSKGFMGQTWDGAEGGNRIAQDPEFWRLVYDVLLPGGYVLAFSSPRTGHRQAVAMEDAGFIMHPFLGWVYGSGFPKGHSVSKAIDKARVEDLEPIRRVCRKVREAMDRQGLRSKDLTRYFGGCHPRLIDHWAARDTDSQPAVPRWEQWQVLKAVLSLDDSLDSEVRRLNARKGEPGDAWRQADVVGEYAGTPGGFGAHRFSVRDNAIRAATPEAAEWEGWYYGTQSLKPALEPIYMAQKPFATKAGYDNVLTYGTGAVNIDACRVEAEKPTGWGGAAFGGRTWNSSNSGLCKPGTPRPVEGRWPANLIHDGSDEVLARFPGAGEASAARFFYCAKATKADRAGSKHPTVKPIALLRWLCRLVTPPGGVILDPFAGSGTTGEAARLEGFRAVLIEREAEYAADIRRRFGLPAEAEEFPEDILEILGPLDDPEILELLG